MIVRILGRQPLGAGGFQEIIVSSDKGKGTQLPGVQPVADCQGGGQVNRVVAPQAMMSGQFNGKSTVNRSTGNR